MLTDLRRLHQRRYTSAAIYPKAGAVSVIYVEQTRLWVYGGRTTADKERARYLRP